jgi:hypothetical protein
MAESFLQTGRAVAETVAKPSSFVGSTALLLAWLLLLLPAPAYAQSEEYRTKAEMLHKFALFVDWPAQAFAEKTSPFLVCLLGEDSFGELLHQQLGGLQVGDHPVEIRQVGSGEQARDCHLLFISRSEEERLAEILAQLRDGNVLTVSDIDGFCEQGGMIDFITGNGRMRFDLNATAAKEANLKIGSGLKGMARTVNCGGAK